MASGVCLATKGMICRPRRNLCLHFPLTGTIVVKRTGLKGTIVDKSQLVGTLKCCCV